MKRYSKIHLWGLNKQTQDVPTTSTTIIQSADSATLNKEINQNRNDIQNLITEMEQLVQKIENASAEDSNKDEQSLVELKSNFETFKENNGQVLTTLKDEIQKKIKDVESKIDIVKTNLLSDIATKIEELRPNATNDLAVNAEGLANLQTALESQIDLIKENLIQQIASNKTLLEEELSKLATKLDQSKNEVIDKASGQDVTLIEKQIADIKTEFQTKLESLEIDQKAMESLKVLVQSRAAGEDLTNLKTTLESEIDSLKSRVIENRNEILEKLTEELETLQNLKTIVQNNETKINDNISKIKDRLDTIEESAPTRIEMDFFHNKIITLEEKFQPNEEKLNKTYEQVNTLENKFAFHEVDIEKLLKNSETERKNLMSNIEALSSKVAENTSSVEQKIQTLKTMDEQISTKMNKVETTQKDTQTKVEAAKKSIQELKTKCETTSNNVSSIKTQLDNHISEVENKFVDNSRVNQLQTNIQNLLDKFEVQKQNVQTNQERISALSSDIETVKNSPQSTPTLQTDDFVKKGDIEGLSSDVKELKIIPDKLREFGEKLETLANAPNKEITTLSNLITETRTVIDEYASSLEYEKLPNLKREILESVKTSEQQSPGQQTSVLQFFSYDDLVTSEKINLQTGRPRYNINFDAEIIGVAFYDPINVHSSLLINLGHSDIILARSEIDKDYYYQELNYPIKKGNSLEFHSHNEFSPQPKKPSFYAEIYLKTQPI